MTAHELWLLVAFGLMALWMFVVALRCHSLARIALDGWQRCLDEWKAASQHAREEPPSPDHIGDICRLLVEKSWEWEPGETTDDDSAPCLTHLSGVWVAWDWLGERKANGCPHVWLGYGRDVMGGQVLLRDEVRLFAAVQGNARARVTSPHQPFDGVAQALANAVKAGNHEAARELAARLTQGRTDATTTEGA